jgi:hypothetical protein
MAVAYYLSQMRESHSPENRPTGLERSNKSWIYFTHLQWFMLFWMKAENGSYAGFLIIRPASARAMGFRALLSYVAPA